MCCTADEACTLVVAEPDEQLTAGAACHLLTGKPAVTEDWCAVGRTLSCCVHVVHCLRAHAGGAAAPAEVPLWEVTIQDSWGGACMLKASAPDMLRLQAHAQAASLGGQGGVA